MAVMTSFHAEKCCHLVGEREAYAAVFRQFLIYSSFVLLFFYVVYLLTCSSVVRRPISTPDVDELHWQRSCTVLGS